jgi:hypothetical protein
MIVTLGTPSLDYHHIAPLGLWPDSGYPFLRRSLTTSRSLSASAALGLSLR